jgi:hypothetical protein
MASLILFLLPFVQLGVSYYASIATAVAVLSVLCWGRFFWSRPVSHWVSLGILSGLMFVSFLAASSADPASDLLRIGREAVFFILICTAVRSFETQSLPKPTSRLVTLGLLIVGALTLLALVQTMFLAQQRLIGIPKSLYVQNSATIPGLLNLRYSAQRPMGTFGEPSYFGFVLLSLFMMFGPLVRSNRLAAVICLLIPLCGILTKSLSFLVFFPVTAALLYWPQLSPRDRVRTAALAVVAAVGFAAAGSFDTAFQRIGHAANGEADMSILIRTIVPIGVAGKYLLIHPFGLPPSRMAEALAPLSGSYGYTPAFIMDNAALNMIFSYGVIGIALLVYLLRSSRNAAVVFYLLACTQFNGALLSVDKFAVICSAAALFAGGRAFLSSRGRGKLTKPSARVGFARPGVQATGHLSSTLGDVRS